MTPASREKVTCLARPSAPVSSMETFLIWPDHCGYASKSAMTAMTSDLGALIVMLELAWSAMGGPYYHSALSPSRCLPLQDVRRPPAAEVPDVDALGASDPCTAHKRVVHVPEQHELGLCFADRLEQRLTPPLHAASEDVVQQLRHCRWDVRAEHVDRAYRGDLGGIVLVRDLVRRAHRRLQAAADEAERPVADARGLAVENRDSVADVLSVEPRNVDISVSDVRRGRHRGEQVGVLPADGLLDHLVAVPAHPGPQLRREPAGLVEPALGAQRDQP